MFRGIIEPPKSQKPHLILHHATQLPVLFSQHLLVKMGSHLDSNRSNILSAWLVTSDYSKAPREVLATLINLRERYWLAQIPISQTGNKESHRQHNLTLCEWESEINLNLLTRLFFSLLFGVLYLCLCVRLHAWLCVYMCMCVELCMHVCMWAVEARHEPECHSSGTVNRVFETGCLWPWTHGLGYCSTLQIHLSLSCLSCDGITLVLPHLVVCKHGVLGLPLSFLYFWSKHLPNCAISPPLLFSPILEGHTVMILPTLLSLFRRS